MKKTKKSKKVVKSQLLISAVLGVNKLYIPWPSQKPTDPDSFSVTLRVDKKDSNTIKEIRELVTSVANKAVADDRTEHDAKSLISTFLKKKFTDGDAEEYETEHGQRLLKCVCYNTRPATGKIKDGKLIGEYLGKQNEGKVKGEIERGDKVKALVNIYHTNSGAHDHIMVKILGVYLVEKGAGAFSTDPDFLHDKVAKNLGLEVSKDSSEEETDEPSRNKDDEAMFDEVEKQISKKPKKEKPEDTEEDKKDEDDDDIWD